MLSTLVRRSAKVLGLVLVLGGAVPGCRRAGEGRQADPVISRELAQRSAMPSPEARVCADCHEREYQEWLRSQHARANQMVDPARHGAPFEPTRQVRHGTYQTDIQRRGKRLVITQTDPDGQTSYHEPEAMIGLTPLIQYLVPFPGGRLQTVDVAYDPENDEWFNVFGEEDRMPHEWGFWKNRSMTWNGQCAFCHVTNVDKGYDPDTDTYQTTWDVMGVSCAQCHGRMEAHLRDPEAPVTETERIVGEQAIQNCATCHSRREGMTGQFEPGDPYYDHFRPSLADLDQLYYQDGQIRDEVFEYGSFIMSRMGHKGIICLDCHNPHSGDFLIPARNNALCLSCHMPPGRKEAVLIDPATHSRHEVGGTGDMCIECHMPATTYMARDPRRDHGFTIPDPLLTQELGIPNACNRCHADQTTEWSIEWVDKWYGDRMDRRTRHRARVVARAQQADEGVVLDLVRMIESEEIDAWRAVLVGLCAPWVDRPMVQRLVMHSLSHPHPLVRVAAMRALGPAQQYAEAIKPLRRDPVRLVRTDAAWYTLNPLEHESRSYREVKEYLAHVCDQPAGALRQAQLAVVERRFNDAERWARRAVEWESQSAFSRHMLGRVLHSGGKTDEAESAFREAVRLEPENAEHHYSLALLHGELNRPEDAVAELLEAVRIDPTFGRAWYNLGLGYAQLGQLDPALEALQTAEQHMPDSPEPAYARATIHLRRDEKAEAREAAAKALERYPDYRPAATLLQQLDAQEAGPS